MFSFKRPKALGVGSILHVVRFCSFCGESAENQTDAKTKEKLTFFCFRHLFGEKQMKIATQGDEVNVIFPGNKKPSD